MTKHQFFYNDEEYILDYFNTNIEVLKYKNAYMEDAVNSVVKVINYYEILDEIEFKNFTEVYSRFIECNINDTVDIIEKYF